MASPFPGMDPYLEHPALWPGLHNRLVAAIDETLGPILRPRYYIGLEERTYLSEPEGLLFIGRPDIAVVGDSAAGQASGPRRAAGTMTVEVPVPDPIRETFLEIRDARGGEVVTVLEMLSPSNKRPGEGRRLYEEKRFRILGTQTHLVEIDLLRAGEPMTVYGADGAGVYRILVSRGDRRPRAELFAFGVRDPIPSFALPLRRGDEEPQVDLGPILHALYERAAYDLRIDYGGEPVPPLGPEDGAWARATIERAGRA